VKEAGENCIMRNFMVYTLHEPIIRRIKSKEKETGWTI
jgi:hypothetical protein